MKYQRGWLRRKALERRWRREAEAQYQAEMLLCHHGTIGAKFSWTACSKCIDEVENGTHPDD
jgi:hypothetical protein